MDNSTNAAEDLSPPIHHTLSTASFHSTSSAFSVEERVGARGITLQPDTPLYQLPIEQLHPTQLAVGMHQVHEKMAKLAKKQQKGPEALEAFLRSHPVPVVLGPGRRPYLIDHHHLTRAMHNLSISSCYAGTVADYSSLTDEQFWAAMQQHNFLWPFTHSGARIGLHELPQLLPSSVAGLSDDPYRSLAALVRKAGGYQKSTQPFSEFVWANFLRPRVPLVLTAVGDVAAFTPQALSHARHTDAAALPGYCPAAPLTAATPTQQQQQQQTQV